MDVARARFFRLTELVLHEFWLHHHDHRKSLFTADVTTLTLYCRSPDPDRPCTRTYSPQDLEGNLEALAREYYASTCKDASSLQRGHAG